MGTARDHVEARLKGIHSTCGVGPKVLAILEMLYFLADCVDAPAEPTEPGRVPSSDCGPSPPRPGLMPGPVAISAMMLDKATMDCANAEVALRAAQAEQAYWRTRIKEDAE